MAIISSNFIKYMGATNGGQASAQAPRVSPSTLIYLILPNPNTVIGYHVNSGGGIQAFGYPV